MRKIKTQSTDQLEHFQKRQDQLRQKLALLSSSQYHTQARYEQELARYEKKIKETEAIIFALEQPQECDYVPAGALADYAGLSWESIHDFAKLGELGESYNEHTKLFPRSDLARLRNLNWKEMDQDSFKRDLRGYFHQAVAALAVNHMEQFNLNILRLERRRFVGNADILQTALKILRDWALLPFEQLTGEAKDSLTGTFIPPADLDAWLRKGIEALSLTDEQTTCQLKKQFPWAEQALLQPTTVLEPQTPDEQATLLITNVMPELVTELNRLLALIPTLSFKYQHQLTEILRGLNNGFKMF